MSKEKKVEKKPEIEIRLAKDPKSQKINMYMFEDKKAIMSNDVTNDFFATIIGMWAGGVQTIESNDGKVYAISVQEIKQSKESKIIKPN